MPRTRTSGARWGLGLILVAGVAVILMAPATAMAQSALDQYIPSLKPDGTDGGSSQPGGGTRAGDAGGGAGPKGGAPSTRAVPAASVEEGSIGGGEIPGTGYPLTTFIVVVLVAAVLAAFARYLLPRLRGH